MFVNAEGNIKQDLKCVACKPGTYIMNARHRQNLSSCIKVRGYDLPGLRVSVSATSGFAGFSQAQLALESNMSLKETGAKFAKFAGAYTTGSRLVGGTYSVHLDGFDKLNSDEFKTDLPVATAVVGILRTKTVYWDSPIMSASFQIRDESESFSALTKVADIHVEYTLPAQCGEEGNSALKAYTCTPRGPTSMCKIEIGTVPSECFEPFDTSSRSSSNVTIRYRLQTDSNSSLKLLGDVEIGIRPIDTAAGSHGSLEATLPSKLLLPGQSFNFELISRWGMTPQLSGFKFEIKLGDGLSFGSAFDAFGFPYTNQDKSKGEKSFRGSIAVSPSRKILVGTLLRESKNAVFMRTAPANLLGTVTVIVDNEAAAGEHTVNVSLIYAVDMQSNYVGTGSETKIFDSKQGSTPLSVLVNRNEVTTTGTSTVFVAPQWNDSTQLRGMVAYPRNAAKSGEMINTATLSGARVELEVAVAEIYENGHTVDLSSGFVDQPLKDRKVRCDFDSVVNENQLKLSQFKNNQACTAFLDGTETNGIAKAIIVVSHLALGITDAVILSAFFPKIVKLEIVDPLLQLMQGVPDPSTPSLCSKHRLQITEVVVTAIFSRDIDDDTDVFTGDVTALLTNTSLVSSDDNTVAAVESRAVSNGKVLVVAGKSSGTSQIQVVAPSADGTTRVLAEATINVTTAIKDAVSVLVLDIAVVPTLNGINEPSPAATKNPRYDQRLTELTMEVLVAKAKLRLEGETAKIVTSAFFSDRTQLPLSREQGVRIHLTDLGKTALTLDGNKIEVKEGAQSTIGFSQPLLSVGWFPNASCGDEDSVAEGIPDDGDLEVDMKPADELIATPKIVRYIVPAGDFAELAGEPISHQLKVQLRFGTILKDYTTDGRTSYGVIAAMNGVKFDTGFEVDATGKLTATHCEKTSQACVGKLAITVEGQVTVSGSVDVYIRRFDRLLLTSTPYPEYPGSDSVSVATLAPIAGTADSSSSDGQLYQDAALTIAMRHSAGPPTGKAQLDKHLGSNLGYVVAERNPSKATHTFPSDVTNLITVSNGVNNEWPDRYHWVVGNGPNNVLRVRDIDRPQEGNRMPELTVKAFYMDNGFDVVTPSPVSINISATPVHIKAFTKDSFLVEHGTEIQTTTLAGFAAKAQVQVRVGLTLDDDRKISSKYLFSNKGVSYLPGVVSFAPEVNGDNGENNTASATEFKKKPPFSVNDSHGTITLLRNYFERAKIKATVGMARGGIAARAATIMFACNLEPAIVGDVDLGIDSAAVSSNCRETYCVPGGIPPEGKDVVAYKANATLNPISVRVNTNDTILGTYKIIIMYDPKVLKLAENGVIDVVTSAKRGDAGLTVNDDRLNAMVVIVGVILNSQVVGPNEALFTVTFQVVTSPDETGRTEISAVAARLEDNDVVTKTFVENAAAVSGVIDVIIEGERRRRVQQGTSQRQGVESYNQAALPKLYLSRTLRSKSGGCAIPGDTNGDCKFTAGDAFFVLEFSTYSALEFAGARGQELNMAYQNDRPQRKFELDADGNGEVLTSDAFYLQLIDTGLLYFVRDVAYTTDATNECLITLSASLFNSAGEVPSDGDVEVYFALGIVDSAAAEPFSAAELTIESGSVLSGVGGVHTIFQAQRISTQFSASFHLDFPLVGTGVSVLHLGKPGPKRAPLHQFSSGTASGGSTNTSLAPLNFTLPLDSYFGGTTRAIETQIKSEGKTGYFPKKLYTGTEERGLCNAASTTVTNGMATTLLWIILLVVALCIIFPVICYCYVKKRRATVKATTKTEMVELYDFSVDTELEVTGTGPNAEAAFGLVGMDGAHELPLVEYVTAELFDSGDSSNLYDHGTNSVKAEDEVNLDDVCDKLLPKIELDRFEKFSDSNDGGDKSNEEINLDDVCDELPPSLPRGRANGGDEPDSAVDLDDVCDKLPKASESESLCSDTATVESRSMVSEDMSMSDNDAPPDKLYTMPVAGAEVNEPVSQPQVAAPPEELCKSIAVAEVEDPPLDDIHEMPVPADIEETVLQPHVDAPPDDIYEMPVVAAANVEEPVPKPQADAQPDSIYEMPAVTDKPPQSLFIPVVPESEVLPTTGIEQEEDASAANNDICAPNRRGSGFYLDHNNMRKYMFKNKTNVLMDGTFKLHKKLRSKDEFDELEF
jgi:hypothetical protein